MIHIVFNEEEVLLMKTVQELDPSLEGPVWLIRDDFAAGPLQDLDTEEGWQQRVNWWKELAIGSPYPQTEETSFDDRLTVAEIKEQLAADPDLKLWIWMAQNQHDVSGYFWLIPQLKELAGQVEILYMNNLPFINEKGQLFYPSWLHEIPAKEFLKAKRLARPVTLSEFEVDPDEWRKLVVENAPVRMLEGGKKLIGKEEDFYDGEIIKNITGEWQKANRVITNTLNRMKIKTGDIFLMGRLKNLIDQGRVEVNGDRQKGWKDFDVRLIGSKQEEKADASQTTA